MSNSGKHNFRSSSAARAAKMQRDERVLNVGLARNRVTGAGKHLLAYDIVRERENRIKNAKTDLAALAPMNGCPWNTSMSIPDGTSYEDIRRLTGWIACSKQYPAAAALIAALCSRKGMNSPRHFVSNMLWFIRLWRSPGMVTWDQVRGARWCAKAEKLVEDGWRGEYHILDVTRVKNPKFFSQLGKIGWAARWAVAGHLLGYGLTAEVTHRDLKWEVLAGLKSRRQLLEFLPDTHKVWAEWHLAGLPVTRDMLGKLFPRDIKKSTALTLMKTHRVSVKRPEMVDALYRLVLMFGADVPAARRYINGFCDRSSPFHDAAQSLPLEKTPKGWAAFVGKFHSHDLFGPVMGSWKKVQEVLGRAPISISDIKEEYRKKGQVFAFDLTEAECNFITRHPPKGAEMCPHVVLVDGMYTLTKLEFDDARQVTAGRLTYCCQHLGGVGADCARKAWLRPECAIYAVFKDSQMMAQAFAWRATDGSLIFDSVESPADGEVKVKLASLYARAASELVGRLGITYVGVTEASYGITKLVGSFSDKKYQTPRTGFELNYSDAGPYVIVLAGSETIHAEITTAFQKYCDEEVPTEDAVNELMEDSDVFCEHCGAEVHPECAICPICHNDISEWV